MVAVLDTLGCGALEHGMSGPRLDRPERINALLIDFLA
jgi:hypothetical protein